MSHDQTGSPTPGRIADKKHEDILWVPLVRVFPPNDIIIESLLRSQGIPYRVKHHGIPQFPMAVGPFAETVITVPQDREAEARQLLQPCPDCLEVDNEL